MVPSRTHGRNKREADYSNVGVAGRKTGVTLKDTGVRDEYGMEPIDGVFSSPEKSPPKRNGGPRNSTITEEEDMDIGESTIPEPTEILSRKRNSKTFLPPPRARSPIKTTLGSSPRRSVGPMSSPIHRTKETPNRAMSHPLVNRRLDYSKEQLRPSVSSSLQNGQLSKLKNGRQNPKVGKGKKRAYNLSMDDDEEDEDPGDVNGVDTTNGNDLVYDESAQINNGDDSLLMLQDDEDQDLVEEQQSEPNDGNDESELLQDPGHRPSQNPSGKLRVNGAVPVEPEFLPSPDPATKKPGRPRRTASVDFDASQISVAEAKSRGGRPTKKAKTNVQHESEAEEDKKSPIPTTQHAVPPAKAGSSAVNKRKGPKATPAKRHPNARIIAAKKVVNKTPSVEPEPKRVGSARPKPRSLFVLRSETPADDAGALTTRSGRTSVKPMAFWRNERIVYGDGNLSGSSLTLPGIKEVIRTDEIVEPKPKRAPVRRRPARKRELEDLDEEDEEQEPWETNPGTMRAEVMRWDPDIGEAIDEDMEETDIAFAPAAIQMRQVKGTAFGFAKILNVDFFGSGMVDLPPGGEKRVKNSRKMHLCFFVHTGRVIVDVGGNPDSLTRLSIGKGGMFQVPRGNFYGIANNHQQPARLFFAQGHDAPSTAIRLAEESTDDRELLKEKGKGKGKGTARANENGIGKERIR